MVSIVFIIFPTHRPYHNFEKCLHFYHIITPTRERGKDIALGEAIYGEKHNIERRKEICHSSSVVLVAQDDRIKIPGYNLSSFTLCVPRELAKSTKFCLQYLSLLPGFKIASRESYHTHPKLMTRIIRICGVSCRWKCAQQNPPFLSSLLCDEKGQSTNRHKTVQLE
jgi:hypothetical protein